MADYRQGDQAAGLRRLFARKQTRVVAFASGGAGAGKSVIVANLAVALAHRGKEVLVLDESGRNGIPACFGAAARHDLLQVVERQRPMAEVLLTVAPGVRVLPAALAVGRLCRLSGRQQEALLEGVASLENPPDVVLVDASPDHPLGFSPLALAAHDAVIVISAAGTSITESYALIKKVVLGYARRNFRIVVNRARSPEEALAIHANMDSVARARRLAALDYGGFVPHDERLRQACRLCQPVVDLFPDSPSARAQRALAGELLAWPLPDEAAGGLEQFMRRLLHLSRQIDPVAIHA